MSIKIERTKDVEITEDISFRDMMLSPPVLAGLTKCNFEKPSPIQLRAIPIGRCGLDLIIQSKSGTGKTLVYCTIILERYNSDIKTPQSLVVVPTREIALQVEAYLNNIGSSCSGFSVASVIGGRDIGNDRVRINKCKAIVGTPGRLLHLIKNKFICLQNISILVLDEADKLVADDFYNDINILLDALNGDRQIIATSATYANGLDKQIVSFMQKPIAISAARETPVLIGVKQFKLNVERFSIPQSVINSNASIQAMWRKVSAVNYILSTTAFKQCILFSNSQLRAKSFANYLSQNKWSVELVLGSHDQTTRIATLQKFRQYKSRILITSDLMARGVDIVNVNLVINLDVPGDSSTYLHRIGRCGRFGRKGLAVTLIGDAAEMVKFQTLLEIIGGSKINVASFSIDLHGDTKFNAWNNETQADCADPVCHNVNTKPIPTVKTNQNDAVDLELFNSNGLPNIAAEEVINNNNNNLYQNENGAYDETKSIEQKNLKLLEVAKLLIDDKPTPPSVENLDTDLFASFQLNNESVDSGTQPIVTISENLFEEFSNTKHNTSNGEDEACEYQNENSCFQEKLDQDLRKADQPVDKEIDEPESLPNIPKKNEYPKNQHQHQKLTDLSRNMSTANELWSKIYWQQLSDINQYVKNSSYM